MEISSVGAPEAATDADERAIAQRFVHARRQALALAEYPGAVPATLASAYRCQELAIEQWSDRVAGWKVARIPDAFRAQYPEERLIGPVFARNVYVPRPGEVVQCPVFAGGLAAVEAELVIRVRSDAPPAKTLWTVEEAAEFVESLHIGVEVASSPLATLNDLGTGAVVSDFGNNWGVVVGAAIADWRSVTDIAALTYIEGELVGRGKALVRDGALGALAFTLAKSASRGRPLRAGDVISTGMITGVHDIRVGQRSRHVFAGCGEVHCQIVAASASADSPADRQG